MKDILLYGGIGLAAWWIWKHYASSSSGAAYDGGPTGILTPAPSAGESLLSIYQPQPGVPINPTLSAGTTTYRIQPVSGALPVGTEMLPYSGVPIMFSSDSGPKMAGLGNYRYPTRRWAT